MSLPFHVAPVIVDDQVRLRIYRGGEFELELPLRQRKRWLWPRDS